MPRWSGYTFASTHPLLLCLLCCFVFRCVKCGKNLAEVAEGNGLKFFLDGQAVHLVLEIPDMRQSGACFSVMFKNVPEGKGPSDENPYASVSHVCCANREKGKICGKKVGVFAAILRFDEMGHLFSVINPQRVTSFGDGKCRWDQHACSVTLKCFVQSFLQALPLVGHFLG